MTLFKALLALFLGGYLGALVGLELHKVYSMVTWPFSSLLGSFIGFFAYKPKEIITAFRTAFSDAVKWRPCTKEEFEVMFQTWKHNRVAYCYAMLIFMSYFFPFLLIEGYVWNQMKEAVKVIGYISGASILSFPLVPFVPSLEEARGTRINFARRLRRSNSVVVAFRIIVWFFTCCIPWIVRIAIKTPGVILQIVVNTLQASATHKRITISASSAVGATLGFLLGSALLGGIIALAVGYVSILSGEHILIKQRL